MHTRSGTLIILALIMIQWLLFPSCIHKKENTKSDLTQNKPAPNLVSGLSDSLVKLSVSLAFSNPDSSRALAACALAEAVKSNNQLLEFSCHSIIGGTYYVQSNHIKALESYTAALAIALQMDDPVKIAHSNNGIGIVQNRAGNYQASLEAHMTALRLSEKNGNYAVKTSVLNNLGFLYGNINNHEKSISYYEASRDEAIKNNDTLSIALATANIGSEYTKTGKHDSALYFIDKGIDLIKNTPHNYQLSSFYVDKAKVFVSLKDFVQALDYYKKSQKIAVSMNNLYEQIETDIGMAKIYLELKHFDTAMKSASIAMEKSNQLNNLELKQKSHEVFSYIYERLGDFPKSLSHYRSYVALKDSLINQTKLHELYNKEIQSLSQEKEIKQLEIQRQELLLNKKNNTIFVILAGSLFTIFLVYLLYRTKQYKEQVAHSTEIMQLNDLRSRAAIEAEIHERQRIGRELHDGLGQLLSVAMINISILQQKSTLTNERRNELLDAAILGLDKAFNELRSISHNLAPPALANKGFIAAINELVDQVNSTEFIKVHLEIFGFNGAFDSIIENTLFRAIQELTNNALKHAKANKLFIQLIKNESEVTLMVEDDGMGFDINDAKSRVGGGLVNINSRIENLKGKFFVDSKPERGTIATIVLPIK